MSEIKVNKISPATGTAITLGDSGDTFTVPSGGTIVNSGTATGFGGGAWNKIKTLTASASADLSFVNGTSDVVFDNTYDYYVFTWTNIHPSASSVHFQFQFSIDTGSNYNTAIASNEHSCHIDANGSGNAYDSGDFDLHGTTFQTIGGDVDMSSTHSSTSGTLQVWGVGSTTYYKHFIAESSTYAYTNDYQRWELINGRSETTSAIDAIQFKFASGNIDAGSISMYGVTK